MQSIVAYVRTLLGWCDDNPIVRTSFKRDRNDDDFSSDEESPVLKRLKKLPRTSFPDVMDSKDMWSEEKQNKNVRYIPIQIESDHPSTSTPIDVTSKLGSRFRTVPMRLTSNGPSPVQRPRKHTPVRPVTQPVIDDEDDQQEVTWVEAKPETKKPSKVYINIDDEDEDYENQDDDVIFVKAVSSPPPIRPYKFFVSKNNNESNSKDDEYVKFIKVGSKLNDRSSLSPRAYTKFKAPAGITKVYKKAPTPVPRWMQAHKTNLQQSRSKLTNGNGKSAMAEVFNLDEKRNYQELIRRVTGNIKPSSIGKPLDIKNLADESAAFRSTLRSQKSALNELKLVEQGLSSIKDNESTQEYDPITVASINSSDSEVEIITSDASTSSSVKIDPINTLKDSYRDRAITSTDWLSKLDSKYRKKRQETQEKLKDARRESDIISKVNYEQKLAHLEHKLKYELSIPESLIEEVQPTVELPPLTPEQEKLVNRALGPGPPGQLLVEKFNLRIHRRDLQTLAGLNWLNDEVINFYMNLLMQRSEERKELPRVYATNTFFYPKLMQSGQAGLRRWTRKVDIFGHDLMVVPVHLGVHWCLSLIDFREKKISYLDSMGARNEPCLAALLQYLRDEHQDKKGQAFDDAGWKTENMKDIPQQMNGSDCGMFACTFAEFSSRGARYTFSQAHMPYLRRKAALEILQARLLL
ncbi:putative sentrin/sumo-specific protease [Danaus plexippus plexippus]|uniref:Sentrin/sumo-specific protease n=1 Tax=Danaus plexippus plexippus TaxID=278856 RepID=A0A212EH13_DANPL|nr:putative sentrin/sumo-specific protease [Danaus plexippus plexippus]